MPDCPNLEEARLRELELLRPEWLVLDEARPPGMSRAEFVRACIKAREEKCEMDQAIKYLFEEEWVLRVFHCPDGNGEFRVVAIRHSLGLNRTVRRVTGETFAEVVVALAAKVEEA